VNHFNVNGLESMELSSVTLVGDSLCGEELFLDLTVGSLIIGFIQFSKLR
jgi:hypothetical protein